MENNNNMLSYLIKDLVDSLSKTILSNLDRNNLSKEIDTYLLRLYDKLRLTKNILFRNEPVDFYDSYLPLTLKSKTKVVRMHSPVTVLDEFSKLAVLGAAGSGKTTLLRFLTLQCIEEEYGIPVYIELRNFSDEKLSFEEFVATSITNSADTSKALFSSGKFVFVFDGFDEINYKEGRDIIFQIENFISKYNENKFVISSRPGTNIESLSQFYVFDLCPLNWNDITLYVDRLELPNKMKKILFQSFDKDEIFFSYLTNPLFLSLYINYLHIHSTQNIPNNKSVFFRNILDTLFSQHDSVSKLGFVRNKLSGLNKDELESVATLLAFRAVVTSTSSFSKDHLYKELELIKRNTGFVFENENIIYDLTITVNILISNNGYYNFPHILFLEYLASLFISRVSLEKKSNVYKQFLNSDKIVMNSSFINFLYELDYLSFSRNFLIPSLEMNLNRDFFSKSKLSHHISDFVNLLSAKSTDSLTFDSYNEDDHYEFLQELKQNVNINGNDNLDELMQF